MILTQQIDHTEETVIKWPSFSIVIETENLDTDHQSLLNCLDSLKSQDFSIEKANDILLVSNTLSSHNSLKIFKEKYPFLSIIESDEFINYYDQKMFGTERITGDIIVFADSDCIYEPSWLQNLLIPFIQDVDIKIVAGATKTSAYNIYSVAIAIIMFSRYPRRTNLYPVVKYYPNNVAMLRSIFLDNKYSKRLPYHRLQIVLHSLDLLQRGYTIWKQPKARAVHAIPSTVDAFFWRFIMLGSDFMHYIRVIDKKEKEFLTKRNLKTHSNIFQSIYRRMKIRINNISALLLENPKNSLYLPFTVPIIFSSRILIITGLFISYFNPNYLFNKYKARKSSLKFKRSVNTS